MSPTLTTIPSELFFEIAAFLEINHIIALRKTCHSLASLTRDRSIWLNILGVLRSQDVPFPAGMRSADDLRLLSGLALETLAISAYRIARAWPVRRCRGPVTLRPKSGDTLIGMDLFTDVWLLTVYAEGLVYLWDISSRSDSLDTPGKRCASLDLGCSGWTSYAAALSTEAQSIILVVTCTHRPTQSRVYDIPLDNRTSVFSDTSIALLFNMTGSVPMSIRTIDISRHLMAFSYSCRVDIVSWHSGSDSEPEKVTISTETEDLEELWNGIVALRFAGPYILVVKSRSIELHPLPAPFKLEARPLLPITRPFPSTTFRQVSLTEAEFRYDTEERRWSLSLLAYDIHQGLFHYTIELCIPNDSVPRFDIDLISTYSMGTGTGLQPEALLAPAASPRGHTRGFISAQCLGPQGLRGVWVERRRTHMLREVVVWSRSDAGQTEDASGAVDGRVVYAVGSYDLREDLTHCVLGEISGRIVLGNRAGDVMLLDVEVGAR